MRTDPFDRHRQVEFNRIATRPHAQHVEIAAALFGIDVDRLAVDARGCLSHPARQPELQRELAVRFGIELDLDLA